MRPVIVSITRAFHTAGAGGSLILDHPGVKVRRAGHGSVTIRWVPSERSFAFLRALIRTRGDLSSSSHK